MKKLQKTSETKQKFTFTLNYDIIVLHYLIGIPHYVASNENQEIALVGGLHPAVTYKFRVFAINFIDSSEPTRLVVAKTQEEGKFNVPYGQNFE
jgi:hypothetical protein